MEEENLEGQESSPKPAEESEPSKPSEPQKPSYEDLEAQNKRLYARAKAAEESLKIMKEEAARKPEPEPAKPTVVSESDIEERVNLRLEGYSPEELKFIQIHAKGLGKRLSEVKDDPFIQSAIEGLRAKKKSEQAVPPPSQPAFQVEGKTWDKMKQDERKGAYQKILDQQVRARTGGRDSVI